VPTSDGHAIVWYQEGFPEAQASARFYARVMPEIWRKLTKEFGPPLSDAKEPCYHGPDGRFDIYVDDAITFLAAGGFGTRGAGSFLAITLPYPSNATAGQFCTERPAWIAIKPGNARWVRELKFKNGLSGKGHVEAILYLSDGTRKLEDWTGKSEVKLCRDRPEEDVTKLLIVTTNPSPTAGIPAYRHKMTVVNRCEPETISGPFSGVGSRARPRSTCWPPTRGRYPACLPSSTAHPARNRQRSGPYSARSRSPSTNTKKRARPGNGR
jgi:hypothetical protein